MDATEAGDTATVLGMMTDDVVFMAPRDPFGKAAFEATSEELVDVEIEGTYDIRELEVLGDWAYLRNYLELTVTPPDGTPVRRSGHTLTILRKESDGRWRLARDANLVTAEDDPRNRLARAILLAAAGQVTAPPVRSFPRGGRRVRRPPGARCTGARRWAASARRR